MFKKKIINSRSTCQSVQGEIRILTLMEDITYTQFVVYVGLN